MPEGGKILVVRGGAIGDFVLTLPVLRALRERFPDARLEVLGYPHIAELALAGGLVDAVRSMEAGSLAGFFAAGGALSRELTDYFEGCAVILSYLYDPDGIFQANVARCSRAQFIAGPHRPDDTRKLHATACLLRPLERLAIFNADPVPRLFVQPQPAKRPRLALHPGSGSERKNWPEPRWSGLLQQCAAHTNVHILLVGGEAEGGRLDRLSPIVPAERVEVARDLRLTQLAARLAGCFAFIGHDSGISHLAAALGLPCLILWGDTVEEVWRPPSDRARLLRAREGLDTLDLETVWVAAKELLCLPAASPD